MALSWNEIKDRALSFSKDWEGTEKEEAEGKPFLEAFFNIFGVSRRRFGSFEYRVKKLDDKDGFIDLIWKGVILVEMKSKGKDLDKAYTQAKEYLHGLKEHEYPQYILVSDFDIFRLYDLEEDQCVEFRLAELLKNVHHFRFLLGYPKREFKEQDPANVKAAELMGKLHDRLLDIGYLGHPLEVYLVRVLFCLFAEDTNIFDKQIFQDYVAQRTAEDGSDLASKLQEVFQVLNTPKEKRFKNIDEQLNEFPYVNGKLFEEILPVASFDRKMRLALLECCYLDWSRISPAIFGSMFQSIMNPKERRDLGAHYTSESNILKVIKSLFLDQLWADFEQNKHSKQKLTEFHKKISSLKFLDPACGCGNFLIVTYRELRLLELAILKVLYKNKQGFLDIESIVWLDVDQFYGIEYEEFPVRIAETAMWLIDHQMNTLISMEFGQYYKRLPLKKAAKIVHGNALQIDWESIIPQNELSFILGNPPFIGSKLMKENQRKDLLRHFENSQGSGVLDYVTAWYIKAAKYIQNSQIKVAFVSTNSIVQGEQTSILWGQMFNKYKIKIHFAHRTFKWTNEGKGKAAVYCIIVGFANFDTENKSIFEYEDIKGEAHEVKAKNINAYLLDAKDVLIDKKSNPICAVPKMCFGNMPLDGGNLLLFENEKNELLQKEPKAEKYLKRVFGGEEFLNNTKRWCLWLDGVNPSEIKSMPEVTKRINLVRKFRLNSVAPSTQKFAETPYLFRDRRLANCYMVLPKVNSERRKYIPVGFFSDEQIATDLLFMILDCSLFHFGIISSFIHNVWTKNVCGRLGNEIRYSKDIVYNNFPFPENPNAKQIKDIEKAGQKVLDARANFPTSSLADLYDPLVMPPALIKAHKALDKVVDLAYRPQAFTSDSNRMEFLFELYEKYTADLFRKEKVKKIRKKKDVFSEN